MLQTANMEPENCTTDVRHQQCTAHVGQHSRCPCVQSLVFACEREAGVVKWHSRQIQSKPDKDHVSHGDRHSANEHLFFCRSSISDQCRAEANHWIVSCAGSLHVACICMKNYLRAHICARHAAFPAKSSKCQHAARIGLAARDGGLGGRGEENGRTG